VPPLALIVALYGFVQTAVGRLAVMILRGLGVGVGVGVGVNVAVAVGVGVGVNVAVAVGVGVGVDVGVAVAVAVGVGVGEGEPTVKMCVLVAVPPLVVIAILPVVAPVGTSDRKSVV
jgi:hypothetical protein